MSPFKIATGLVLLALGQSPAQAVNPACPDLKAQLRYELTMTLTLVPGEWSMDFDPTPDLCMRIGKLSRQTQQLRKISLEAGQALSPEVHAAISALADVLGLEIQGYCTTQPDSNGELTLPVPLNDMDALKAKLRELRAAIDSLSALLAQSE